MILDALFMAVFHWGLAGAAAATALSQTLGGIIPLLYFSRKNTRLLQLGKTKFDGRALWKACINGSSELMSNISMSLVSMLYNIQLIKYAGENGVAAYGVNVRQHDLSCYFHRLFYRYSACNQLSLRRSKSWRAKKSAKKEFSDFNFFFTQYACSI